MCIYIQQAGIRVARAAALPACPIRSQKARGRAGGLALKPEPLALENELTHTTFLFILLILVVFHTLEYRS